MATLTTSRGRTYEFSLEKQNDGNIRVYILRQPSYGSRDTGSLKIHRIQESNGRAYICRTGSIRTEKAAQVSTTLETTKGEMFMCYQLPYQPLWLPELNCLAGFKVTEKRNGMHVGYQNFTYPINTLRLDPRSVYGDHNRCLHFAYDPQTAKQNLLGSYGSHLLFCALIPRHYWSQLFKSENKACLHGDLTVTLSCLTCGEGDYEEPYVLRANEVESYLSYTTGYDPLDWVRQLPVVSS